MNETLKSAYGEGYVPLTELPEAVVDQVLKTGATIAYVCADMIEFRLSFDNGRSSEGFPYYITMENLQGKLEDEGQWDNLAEVWAEFTRLCNEHDMLGALL